MLIGADTARIVHGGQSPYDRVALDHTAQRGSEVEFGMPASGFAAIALIIMGVFVLVLAARDWWRQSAMQSWTTVPGRITESGVRIRHRQRPSAPAYVCWVAFRYTVDGIGYRSTNASFRDDWGVESTPASAEALAAEYYEGRPVTVYHDPSRPERGVLEPGMPQEQILTKAGVASVFLVIGAFLLL